MLTLVLITLGVYMSFTRVGGTRTVCAGLEAGVDLRGLLWEVAGVEVGSPSRKPKSPVDALAVLTGALLDVLGDIKPVLKALFFDEGVFLVEAHDSEQGEEGSAAVVMHTRMSMFPEYVCSKVLDGSWDFRGFNLSASAAAYPSASPFLAPLASLVSPSSWCTSCFGHGLVDPAFAFAAPDQLWCVSDPCGGGDSYSSSSSCRVFVDPLSNVCLSSGPSSTMDMDITYTSTATTVMSLSPLYPGDTGTPAVQRVGSDNREDSPALSLSTLLSTKGLYRAAVQAATEHLPRERWPFSMLLHAPVRPMALAAGVLLVSQHEALAASSLLHHLLAVLFGSGSSLFLLGSTWSALFAGLNFFFPGFGGLLPLVSMLPIALVMVPSLRGVYAVVAAATTRVTSLSLQADAFWGAVPFWAICALASVVLLRVFDLFGPGSGGRMYLRTNLRLGGFLCLLHASSNWVVALLLVAGGAVGFDSIVWAVTYMWLQATGTDLQALRGTFLSRAEYDVSGKMHTAQGLEALRQHLRGADAGSAHQSDGTPGKGCGAGVGGVTRYTDLLFECGKTDTARLLERFVQGSYPGVPYTRCTTPLRRSGGDWSTGSRDSAAPQSWCSFFVNAALGSAVCCIFIGIYLDNQLESDRL
jgi:hypothetical protein